MIFRRSTPSQQTRNTTKNHMSSTPRNMNSNSSDRREPALSASSSSQNAPMAITPPSNPNSMNTMSSNAPMSPLAMAQSRRSPNGPAPFARQDQVRKLTVGREITLNGEIATCDHLVVEGTVTATVKDGQILEIMEKGAFSGQVEIEQADIAGKFNGDLVVRGKLVLRSTANVTGTIRYGSLQVDNGAVLNGQIDCMQKAVSAPATTDMQTNTYTSQTTTQNTGTPMQHNTYLSSVLDQPGFLKASGQ